MKTLAIFTVALVMLAIWMLPFTFGLALGARRASPTPLIVIPMLSEPERDRMLEIV